MQPRNETNALGMPIGFDVENWDGAQTPSDDVLPGKYCCCQPLNLECHSAQLFDAYKEDLQNRIWVYLPYGPFDTLDDYRDWMQKTCFNGDPKFYAIIDNRSKQAIGVASYLRIQPSQGSIEVGHINYSPQCQGTIIATEAMYLMMNNAFALGYRRYEWKCNALNEKSCNLAKRLGFTYEGTFRQMLVVKGKNRDSAWYSLLDREWQVIDKAFRHWLQSDNFDHQNQQKTALSSLTKAALDSL